MTLIATSAGVERMTTWDEGGGVGGIGSEGDSVTTRKETTSVSGIVNVNVVDVVKSNIDHQISPFTSSITLPITSNDYIINNGKGVPGEDEKVIKEEELEEKGKDETKTVAAEFIRREVEGLERYGKENTKCSKKAGMTKNGKEEEKEGVMVFDQKLQNQPHKNDRLTSVVGSCRKNDSDESPILDIPEHHNDLHLYDLQGARVGEMGGVGESASEINTELNQNCSFDDSSLAEVSSTTVLSSFFSSSSTSSASSTSVYSHPQPHLSPSPSLPSSFSTPHSSSSVQFFSNHHCDVVKGEEKVEREISKNSSDQNEHPLGNANGSKGNSKQHDETSPHGDSGPSINNIHENGDTKNTGLSMTGDAGERTQGKKEQIDYSIVSAARKTSKCKVLVEQRTWNCRVASQEITTGSGPIVVKMNHEIITATGNKGTLSPIANSTPSHHPTTASVLEVKLSRNPGGEKTETHCKGIITGEPNPETPWSSQKGDQANEVNQRIQDSSMGRAEEGYTSNSVIYTSLGSGHSREQDKGHQKGDNERQDNEEEEKVNADSPAKKEEKGDNVKSLDSVVSDDKDKENKEESLAANAIVYCSSCKPDRCPDDYGGEEEKVVCDFDNNEVVEVVIRSSGVDNEEEKQDKCVVTSQKEESMESCDHQERTGGVNKTKRKRRVFEQCVGDTHHKADCDTYEVSEREEVLPRDDFSCKGLSVNDQKEHKHMLGLDLHDHAEGDNIEVDPCIERTVEEEHEKGERKVAQRCDAPEAWGIGSKGATVVIDKQTSSLVHLLHTHLFQAPTPPSSPPPQTSFPFVTSSRHSPLSSTSATLALPQQSFREAMEPAPITSVEGVPELSSLVMTSMTKTTSSKLTSPSPGSSEDVISVAETPEGGRLMAGPASCDTATGTSVVTIPALECATGQGKVTAAVSRGSNSPLLPSLGSREVAEATQGVQEMATTIQVLKATTEKEASDSQGGTEVSGCSVRVLPHSCSSCTHVRSDGITANSTNKADALKKSEEGGEDKKYQLGHHRRDLSSKDMKDFEESSKLCKEVKGSKQEAHYQCLSSRCPLLEERDDTQGGVENNGSPRGNHELCSDVDEIVIDAAHSPPKFDSALATCHEDNKAMASYHYHPLLCRLPGDAFGPSQVKVAAVASGYSSKVQEKLRQSLLESHPALFNANKSDAESAEVDSDHEYEVAQKEKLQTACKDIAAALSVLLPSTGNREEAITKSTVTSTSVKTAPLGAQEHKNNNLGRRVNKEGGLPDKDGATKRRKRRTNKKGRQYRKCHGRDFMASHNHSAKRNSFYDNCSTDHSESEMVVVSKSDMSTAQAWPYRKGATQEGMTSSKCGSFDIISNIKLPDDTIGQEKESHTKCDGDIKKCNSLSSPCSSSAPTSPSTSGNSSEDDDEDYCQTEDCGEDCDYCSADDIEDEDDPCNACHKNRERVARICKHSGVITNGILNCYRKRLQDPSEISRVTGHRPFALQSVVRRSRPGRRGLMSIRESSITSDEHPEESEEEEESLDGSNCDLSSSWRFALHRTSGSESQESTLRRKRRSFEGHIQGKCNSLPNTSLRSLSKDLNRRTGEGIARQVSTSDDELANKCSKNSLPRTNAIPPRPPRNPRTRPPAVPSPSGTTNRTFNVPPSSPKSPRPALGLQGLNRSPATSRSSRLPSPALPLSPRSISPRSPSNPNPPFGFPPNSVGFLPSPDSPSLANSRQRLAVEGISAAGQQLQPPASPNLSSRLSLCSAGSSRGFGGCGGSGTEPETNPSDSPRVCSRSGVLVSRNFSISDDECGWRSSVDRRHVTITRHESVYREVAEMGYHLTPDSPVDPYWLTWKLGVLQKTVEEVGGRLEDAEKTVAAWGTVPQDPNLADQHVHNVKKFREGLADLQRGVDDVNDQAARFSAHNVPLTPANSARLHDLNNRWKTLETTVNDRWRQLAGRSREVTPMTPAQLASSVAPPWERATASNKVPYYINHDRESTHWDHPDMMELLDSMAQYNHIKFSAYRTAMKLRTLQKKLALEYAKLQTATGIFDEHGLRGQNDRLIDVNDMVVVLSALYASIASDHPEINTTLAMDLCLNWLLNVYDSQRTGQMRVLSFKVGLVCLCTGHLEEKYRYMFRLIADLNRLVDQRKLGLLLHDCVQVPRQLGEVAAFGGSNIEPSVRSCFTKAGKDRETIEAVHFLSWVQQEPQSLVWLAVLHRVAASENVHHQVKCNICKAYPVVGLRYRCLKCLSFDMCQQCFFGGRSNKSHKVTHPMHEYCTATTTGEDMKDFTKALKNKFKSKRSLQKHAKKGYLPVQTVLEGDALESPAPSPQHNVSSQDMHTRLEMYASRLAEVELRTNSNSTPDSEDEHGLIAQYCQSLSSSDAPLPVPRSPLQIMAAVDAEQKEELEAMIRDLEEENKVLQAEYDRLKAQKPLGSPPEDFGPQGRSETDMIAEAKLLREHKGRLEARMSILEEHNRQLEAQLHRLRQLLEEPSGASSPNKSGTLQTKSVTASQLAMDSPAKVNGHSTAQGGSGGPYEGLEQMSEYVRPPPPPLGSMSHVGNLFSRAGDLGKAVGTLVATMTDEGEKDSRSSHHSTEDSE